MNRLAILLAVALIASACARVPEENSPAAAPQVSEKTGAGDRDQSLDSLTRAFRNLGAVKTFRASMLSDRKQEGIFESKVTAVLPDRFHLVNDGLEVKVIGSDLYRRFPDGSWKMASQATDITSLIDPKKLEAYISSAVEIELIGEEEFNGVALEVYQATLPHIPARRGPHDQLQPFAAKVWVSKQDRLPRKLEGTALVSQFRTEVVYYDYNAKIKVQPPASF